MQLTFDQESIRDLIDRMDEGQLRILAKRMARRLDEIDMASIFGGTDSLGTDGIKPACAPPYQEIHSCVKQELADAIEDAVADIDIDDDELDEMDDEELEEIEWSQVKACICGNIEFRFCDMLQDILEESGEAEVQKLVDGVVKALLDRDIPWANTSEEQMEYRRAYAEAIQDRFRNGDYESLFEGFDYDGQY